mgnify:CR=1 FL=1
MNEEEYQNLTEERIKNFTEEERQEFLSYTRNRKEIEDSEPGIVFIVLWWIFEISVVGFLAYLLFSWLGFSVTEWLLFGIFIILIFIYFKLKS